MHGRLARLVLVTPEGAIIGSLPPIGVATPWWPDVEPIVRAVRERDGIDVTVLRLLDAEFLVPHGGAVTYLAEAAGPVPLEPEPWPGTLDDQPLRNAFASPGGPARDLAWAERELSARGQRLVRPAQQIKTWNLSSLWQLPLADQTVWLKVVPPFFAHEGPLLELLTGERVPRVIAHDSGRTLLAQIDGKDLVDAERELMLDMVALLVDLQLRWSTRVPELLALGLPDWRSEGLSAAIEDVVERTWSELEAPDRSVLRKFVRTLPERFAAVKACGLPDSLVHGDFCPLNVRGTPDALTLLDWGDSTVGHPLLDQSAFLDRIPSESVDPVRATWIQLWQQAVPGADPARAFDLLGPVGTARQAAVYRRFLDNIEPSEHVYHRADPASRLHRTAELLASEALV